jgi:REP element-mobilizing transposase RayT
MSHVGWNSRSFIPHCDAADLVQHIVFATVGEGEGIERYFGAHLLKRPEAAQVVEEALLFFDGERYRIWAWCIMSNHVHVVAQQIEGWPLARIVHSCKSFTANKINNIHGRTGAVWLRNYFDRYMRDHDQMMGAIHYVEQNPVKAGLVETAAAWPLSSARFRA